MACPFKLGIFTPRVTCKTPLGTFTTASTACLSGKKLVWTALHTHTELVCMFLEYTLAFLHQSITKTEIQLSSLE